jgi:hypothetical protein
MAGVTRRFGFEFRGGSTIEVDAETIADAIADAERQTGRIVQRGRCLDGFDNDGPGRADLALADMFAEIRASGETEAGGA